MSTIAHFIASAKVDYIYMHVLTNLTGMSVDDYLEKICIKFPDKKVIVSGAASNNVQRKFINMQRLSNDKMIYEFIHQ